MGGQSWTAEELYAQYLKNERFEGKCANFQKLRKYFDMAELAEELKNQCSDIEKIVYLKPEKESMWASIHIDFIWMFSIKTEQIKLLSNMMELSDSFSINGSSFSTVRLNFGINNIWQK